MSTDFTVGRCGARVKLHPGSDLKSGRQVHCSHTHCLHRDRHLCSCRRLLGVTAFVNLPLFRRSTLCPSPFSLSLVVLLVPHGGTGSFLTTDCSLQVSQAELPCSSSCSLQLVDLPLVHRSTHCSSSFSLFLVVLLVPHGGTGSLSCSCSSSCSSFLACQWMVLLRVAHSTPLVFLSQQS